MERARLGNQSNLRSQQRLANVDCGARLGTNLSGVFSYYDTPVETFLAK